MLDITAIYRTLVPAYPDTVKPGGKEVPATFRISPADGVIDGAVSIIPGKDRAATVFLCTVGDKTEILCERKASGFARKHKLALPSVFVDDGGALSSLALTGGKDPRWAYGKGANRATAHKEEIKAGITGLVAYVRRIGAV